MQTNLFDNPPASFYNTIKAKGTELKHLEKKAKSQEDLILEFFKKHPGQEFTPAMVCLRLEWHETPLTSIRRAISNLTKAGLLEKTDNKVNGIYGMKNFTWKLK